MMRQWIGIFIAGLAVASSTQASLMQLKKGNRLFRNGKYEAALKMYNDGLVDAPNSNLLHFNAGDAAYQTGDFGKAEKEFSEASHSALEPLKAAAQYNRGNALFRQERWADAVEAYKEALRINPNDENAKYNLGVALRAQKNPPKSQQQPKAGNSNDQKNQKSGQNGDKNDDQKNKSNSAAPQQGEMSAEDAKRLLAAAGSGELKKSNQKFPKTDLPHPDEDW